jgi:CubicO group peptidase (beta-lactamase class C family)
MRRYALRVVRTISDRVKRSALLIYFVADLLDSIKSKMPIFAPNQQSTYSNVAFDLLGLVIQRVSNQTYESYIEEAIFKPLNMSKLE